MTKDDEEVETFNNPATNIENEASANINIAEEPSAASTSTNLRDSSKGKGKAEPTDLDPDFMKCKANRLPPLWVSLIEGHVCDYSNCNSNFEKEIEAKMIRKVHKEKKAALTATLIWLI
ncbi:MAG: hypothetical protein Q9161_002044 [Pseudevernia consocians]